MRQFIFNLLDALWFCFTAGIFVVLLAIQSGAKWLWSLWTDGKFIADR